MAAEPPTVTSNLPVPDPTVLTQQAVDRGFAAHEQRHRDHDAAADKAAELVAQQIHQDLVATRELLLEKIAHVADVAGEKFSALEQRGADRDEQAVQAKADNAVGLAAALAAARQSVEQQNTANATASNKQEIQVQRLLEQQAATNGAQFKALADQLGDLKDRVTRFEAGQLGAGSARTETRLNMGQVLLTVSVVIAAISVIIAIIASKP